MFNGYPSGVLRACFAVPVPPRFERAGSDSGTGVSGQSSTSICSFSLESSFLPVEMLFESMIFYLKITPCSASFVTTIKNRSEQGARTYGKACKPFQSNAIFILPAFILTNKDLCVRLRPNTNPLSANRKYGEVKINYGIHYKKIGVASLQ